MKHKNFLILAICLLTFLWCKDNPEVKTFDILSTKTISARGERAGQIILIKETLTGSYNQIGKCKLTGVITNTGGRTCFNVRIRFYLFKNNTVIDYGVALLNSRIIEPTEMFSFRIVFKKTFNWFNVDLIEYDIQWVDG